MSKKHLKFEVEEPETGIEKLIVTGLIANDKFTREIFHIINRKYFKGEVTGILAQWCVDYFRQYNEIPGKNILNLIELQRSKLNEEELELFPAIVDLVRIIIKKYDVSSFNTKYILTKSFKYLEVNSMDHRMKLIERALKKKDTIEAMKIFRNSAKDLFKEVRKPTELPNKELLMEVFAPDRRQSIMELPGFIGYYLKPLIRGKFLALLGPTKRGKSHWLVEFALQAALSGLNVMIFPLELTKVETQELIITRWLNKEFTEDNVDEKEYLIPIFDCLKNQRGDCEKKYCKGSNDNIFDLDTGCLNEFEDEPDHKPCSVCRKNKKKRKNYELATWFKTIVRPVMKRSDIQLFMKEFEQHCTGSLKIKDYPISTATLEDIENDLDNEEAFNNWFADVVIVDSLDNFKKNKSFGEKRHQLTDIWESSSKMSKTRNVLVVSGTQGNRAAQQKDRLEPEDVAEDWTKATVVDGLIALNERGTSSKNKTMKDKYWQRQQIELLLSRYKKFIPGHQCMVLNNFELGQVILDSEEFWFKLI